MSSQAWILVLLIGVIVTMVSYFSYAWIEQYILQKIQNYIQWISTTCSRMFWTIPKKTIILVLVTTTVGMAVLGYAISRNNQFITIIFTALFGWAGWYSIRFILALIWQLRISKFDTQLIDGLNLMANSLKSGLNLSQAIQVLVKEMPNPLSQEFGMVLSQERLGLTMDEALQKMLDRIPSEDLSVAIHSILILRETGGDLSETFDVIASTIRERRKVDGKVKSMTAQGKMQGIIMFLMPFSFLLLLYIMSPAYITPLFSTQLGWIMIMIMIFFQIIGGLWIRKIIKIDV